MTGLSGRNNKSAYRVPRSICCGYNRRRADSDNFCDQEDAESILE